MFSKFSHGERSGTETILTTYRDGTMEKFEILKKYLLKKTRYLEDLLIIFNIAIFTFLFAYYFNVFEFIYEATRPYQYYGVDELIIVSMILAFVLVVFALGVCRDVKKEIKERQLAEKELKKKAEQIKNLCSAGKKIASIVSREQLLPWIANHACKLLDADACYYRIREGDYLVRDGGTNREVIYMENTKLKIGEGLSGFIAKNKRPLIIEDIRKDKIYFNGNKEAAKRLNYSSFIGIPLQVKDEVRGVINVLSKIPKKFGQKDISLLSALADQAALALENARLFSELEKDNLRRKQTEIKLRYNMDELRQAMGGVINALALTVEMKDPYTAGHQKRVADLARAIAKEMGLPGEQIDAIRLAGNIHDIGKITLPGDILSNPRDLTDIELSMIRTHAQAGYDLLKKIDFPWPIAEIVKQHHERVDGSGYPLGLAGNKIDMQAKILAVADVVEAMASHRPYRPALGIQKALEEISRKKGTLYDPAVVEACLILFNQKGYKLKEEQEEESEKISLFEAVGK